MTSRVVLAPTALASDRLRPRSVVRHALLARLAAAEPRVLVVAAPVGSGKSTLLRQWADGSSRPVAWLAVTQAHGAPDRLVHALGGAITTAIPDGPVASATPRLSAADPMRSLARLLSALGREPEPPTIVLDDLHLIGGQPSLDIVAELAARLPDAARLGLAMREQLALPTARWRLAGTSSSLGLGDLALDIDECAALLDGLDVRPTDGLVLEVHERTEGWAAGVYLAGLSLRSGRHGPDASRFAGDDDGIRSYLESEVLADLDTRTRRMLMMTSIADEVSGALADAITGGSGSARRLYLLSHANLLVIPLDPRGRSFRYHSLLRDLLLRQLEDQPVLLQLAHRHAAAWYAAAGRSGDAVDHAFRAGDPDWAAQLVETTILAGYRSGRTADIRRAVARLGPAVLADRPQLTLTAALIEAVEGDPLRATELAAIGLHEDVDPPQPASDGMDRALLRAMLCRDGPEAMLADAERALATHDEAWSWRPAALLAAGSAHLLLGEPGPAQERFAEAERTPEIVVALARFSVRAERALDHMVHRRWTDADAILRLDRGDLLADPDTGRTGGMLWAVADARLAVHRGDLPGAVDRLRRVQVGRVRLTWALPWFALRTLTELARVQLLLGDSQGALVSLAQARDTAAARPRLGTLIATLDELTQVGLRTGRGLPAGSTLTPAELRLLPLLQTYLSFKEIGERLGISSNTVKTEAMSIYGKLDAASRGEAVERATSYGLLEDIFA